MSRAKTLLITGASGFLGTWLAEEAAKAGYTLLGIDLRAPFRPELWAGFATSFCETADLEHLLDGHTLDAVCHLAGGASVANSVADPFADFASLLPGTARLALYVAKCQPQARFVLFSSAAVYGNPAQLPINEETPVLPISPYGAHKALAENLLAQYSRIYGLKATVLRIFSVYGPGLRKQLIWDVCQRALAAHSREEGHIVLFGTGSESRDFIHVMDVCQAVLSLIAECPRAGCEILNLASGTETEVREVALELIRHLQIDMEVRFNGSIAQGDPVNWRADVTRLTELGFRPQISLSDGLKTVANWAHPNA